MKLSLRTVFNVNEFRWCIKLILILEKAIHPLEKMAVNGNVSGRDVGTEDSDAFPNLSEESDEESEEGKELHKLYIRSLDLAQRQMAHLGGGRRPDVQLSRELWNVS